MDRSFQLASLRDRLEEIQARDVGQDSIPILAGAGVRVRALHEWFVGSEDGPQWSPALLPMLDLVRRGFESGLLSRVVWIGRRVFPYPTTLARRAGMLAASVFVDPPRGGARLWAIDLALRTSAPTAVIADGQGRTQRERGACAGITAGIARWPRRTNHGSVEGLPLTATFRVQLVEFSDTSSVLTFLLGTTPPGALHSGLDR